MAPWALLAAAMLVPLAVSLTSPLLAWRDPIYIGAGLAGIVALSVMLVQPVLVARVMPDLAPRLGRRIHLATGCGLIVLVLAHVVGLWLTSPPDVIDVLLFRSPTPFGVWGAVAMWAVFAAGLLALLRKRLGLPLRLWRRSHTALAAVAVVGTAVHALLIEGTMETVSKVALCILAVAAVALAIRRLRSWA